MKGITKTKVKETKTMKRTILLTLAAIGLTLASSSGAYANAVWGTLTTTSNSAAWGTLTVTSHSAVWGSLTVTSHSAAWGSVR